jgi:hypothetical protein
MANHYALVMTTTTGGLPWRYEFTDQDDTWAKDFAKRVLNPRVLPECCMYVELWRIDVPKPYRFERYKIMPATVVAV